jgi:hypothetical protein
VVATLIAGTKSIGFWRLPDLTPCGGVGGREEPEFPDFAVSPGGKMVGAVRPPAAASIT